MVEGPMLAPGAGGEPEPLEWSPHGEWIAVTDGANSSDLWILRRDGSGVRQLTRGEG